MNKGQIKKEAWRILMQDKHKNFRDGISIDQFEKFTDDLSCSLCEPQTSSGEKD